MHLIADVEAKIHALLHVLHLDHSIPPAVIDDAKEAASVALASLKPVVDAGLSSLAKTASGAVEKAVPGDLGTVLGSVAAAAITGEGDVLTAKAVESVAPAPVVE